MNRDRKRMYRFALYGRTHSGKTCMLASLAAGAVGHPDGLTCERMPVTVPKPDPVTVAEPDGGEPSEHARTPQEWEAVGLHAGKEWIDKAMQALDNDDVPEFNRATVGTAPMTVDFQIGSPDRGTFIVRTIDYSGELIHPEEEHDPNSLASALKTCLREYDGFLILGETPRDGDSGKGLADELRRLREAFASLRQGSEATDQMLVAVVFSKWDRFSEINHEDPDAEREKLGQFLDSHPAHASLVEAIRNALVEQPEVDGSSDGSPAVASGNCRIFASSAFGHSVLKDGQELPAPGHRRPFGILDPLVWLSDRRDYLDATQLREQLAERGVMRDWISWRFGRYRKVGRWAKALLSRMPKRSSSAAEVRHIRRVAAWRWMACSAVWAFVAMGLCEVGYESCRSWQFATHVTRVDDPRASEEGLMAARDWFTDYSLRWNGLFVPGDDKAEKLIGEIDAEIDARYWKPVEDAEASAAKADAARKYQARLPNGPHAGDCKWIVADRERETEEQKNEDWLAECKRVVENAANTIPQLQQARNSLQGSFPAPDFVLPEQGRKLAELRDEVVDRLAEVTRKEEWGRFLATYRDALSANDLSTASKLLAERENQDAKWRGLVQEYPQEASQRWVPKIREAARDLRFVPAHGIVQEARDALKHLEGAVRPIDQDLAEKLLESQRGLHPWNDYVNKLEDRHLYRRVQERRNLDTCQEYLERAPLKTMKQEVAAYKMYLEDHSKKHEVTLSLKIFWDKGYNNGGDDHVLQVSINDVKKGDAEIGQATPGTLSGPVGSYSIPNVGLAALGVVVVLCRRRRACRRQMPSTRRCRRGTSRQMPIRPRRPASRRRRDRPPHRWRIGSSRSRAAKAASRRAAA